MNSIFKSLAFAGSLTSVVALPTASTQATGSKNCQELIFKISATAQNREIHVQPDISDLAAFAGFLQQKESYVDVSGNEKIVARYCRPTIVNIQESEESKTLQLLVHGNTYDSKYWSGLGYQEYNYEAHANALGYPTLAIDRLGSGKSTHPNGVTHVQTPYQVELLHKLIASLRGPGIVLPGAPQSQVAPFDRLIWVGHSFGSIVGNQLALKYPRDVDAYVLMGIAKPGKDDFALYGQWEMGFQSASDYDASRFPYDKTYYVTSSKAGRMATFYSDPKAPDFDTAVYDADFATMGTITAGEALTQGLNVTDFAGPVFVITGQEDATFCGNGKREPVLPDCLSGADSKIGAMREYYPRAGLFDFFAQPDAGHCHGTHYTAKQGFDATHDFLAKVIAGGVSI
ncbi:Alpha/Beta hydrolase protein [Microdochium bolleyi]|uniref:Alpha/Beta hydrolase protein n=1 Tax=Microdochium bolleyi TaxID=196109 RepID=A0A136IZY3_9PEZI|nr:Alpha/Beta hydrolase protein [Microdochium bolleyi]